MKSVSSIPKKPFKVGNVSKELIGKLIRVGYEDGPLDEGIITAVDRRIDSIEFLVLKGKRKGTKWSVDSKEQIISIVDTVFGSADETEEKVVFDDCEEFLDIFIEQLVRQAIEVNYPAKELKRLCLKRIDQITMPL